MLLRREAVEPYVEWVEMPRTVGRLPVYIDHEQSILDAEELARTGAATAVPRGTAGPKARVRAWIRRLTAPDDVTRANVARLVDLATRDTPEPTVLVVGGGSVGLGAEALYEDPRLRTIAFDVYASPNIHFIADAHRMPLRDGSVDVVVAQAVLEHVLDPWRVAAEIHRVLRAGGLVYAETPFLQHVHEGPCDFTRFTESGHRWLFRGFTRIDSGAVAGPGVHLIWAVEALARGLLRSSKAGQLAKLAMFWAKYLDRAIPRPYLSDGACGVYFLGRRSDRALAAREMPTEYLGAQRRPAAGAA